MSIAGEWRVAKGRRPDPKDYGFDLEARLAAVVGIRAIVPDHAFTADTLGTERAGSGVLIGDGLVLTIGYLVTEASEIWLTFNDGLVVAGTTLGVDAATGFGLVRILGRVERTPMTLGDSDSLEPGDRIVVSGGDRRRSVAAVVVGKQTFAGYWEYVLDEAIFTAPAHPFWGGTAVIGPGGDLVGIGSLQLEQAMPAGENGHLNMVVPINILKPILADLTNAGRAKQPPRPWLGLFATEIDDRIYVAGLADEGPAEKAGLQQADVIAAVGSHKPADLADLFRTVWSLGPAGAEVPLTVIRENRRIHLKVVSADRNDFLKSPALHS